MAQNLNLPIDSLVPHEDTMSLLDFLLEADQERAVCGVELGPDATFCGEQGVPALVGLEYMAQTIAAHAGYLAQQRGEPVKVGFLLGTPKLTSTLAFFPIGSQLHIEVVKDWGDSEMLHFLCRIFDATSGKQLMDAGLNVFQPHDLSAYLAKNHP